MKSAENTITEVKSRSNFNLAPLPARMIFSFIFIIYCLIVILPILLMVSVSLTNQAEIIEMGYQFIPRAFTLEAYRFLLRDPLIIGRAYLITIGLVVTGVIINVTISAMFAFAISRPDFAFKRFFIVLVLITMIFHGGLPAFYYVYVMVLGLRNNLLAMLLPGLSNGFFILVMHTFFKQSVPNEIIESARIDGSSEISAFFRIVLPISKPILATVAIFTALFYWNDFFHCMIFISDSRLFNLQFAMQRALMNLEAMRRQVFASPAASMMFATVRDVPGEAIRMAMVVVGIGPIIFVYPFFQRYFVSGLTLGSVKE